jgi:hypoxanthine-DNA glycosylase
MRSTEVSWGFKPIATDNARVLILGTLPGEVSQAEQRYYAHQRNQFWRIVGSVFGFSPDLEYQERLSKLKEHGVALWDVCASARRSGSLDSAIRSAQSNAFNHFFQSHPGIQLVCFNGKTAGRLYLRDVLPMLAEGARRFACKQLPSTSPAHAAMLFEQKLEVWREALTSLDRPR